MLQIQSTQVFDDWIDTLRDRRAATRILTRVGRAQDGNLGDVRPVGEGVSEMRIHYGPGYRVYFMRRGTQIILLLCGGDKSTQDKDIGEAKRLARQWKAEEWKD